MFWPVFVSLRYHFFKSMNFILKFVNHLKSCYFQIHGNSSNSRTFFIFANVFQFRNIFQIHDHLSKFTNIFKIQNLFYVTKDFKINRKNANLTIQGRKKDYNAAWTIQKKHTRTMKQNMLHKRHVHTIYVELS